MIAMKSQRIQPDAADCRKKQRVTRIKRKPMAGSKSGHSRGKMTSRKLVGLNQLIGVEYLLVKLLVLTSVVLGGCAVAAQEQQQQQQQQRNLSQVINQTRANKLPDLVSSTSDEPIVALIGQDAFVSCVAKNLQNYTIVWRFTNNANGPATAPIGSSATDDSPADGAITASRLNAAGVTVDDLGTILTAGRQRVTSDDRISIIQSHDTWLLKISNVRLSDTGTYICHTNSEPQVRMPRILSVIKPSNKGQSETDASRLDHFNAIDYNFTDCCRNEYVVPQCQRLCSFQQLASRYQSINIVHECFSMLPSITRCMVAGRNVTDCCAKRHIPPRCNSMCGHQGDTSAMSVQDQSYCADYSASIMSCVAEGVNTLPGQPDLVVVEAVSSSLLKVSWQRVKDAAERNKIDGWVINLTKLSSFEDTISATPTRQPTSGGPRSQTNNNNNSNNNSSSSSSSISVSSSFSTSTGPAASAAAGPLSGLVVVDVADSAMLATVTKLLASSSGTISLKVDKKSTEYSIENLKPYTVYQIQMFAYNSHGRSQLTDPIRALTLAPESELANSGNGDAYVEPSLPDTRKCCLDRGVTLKRCLDTLCDPVEADRATIADLMICAPWSNTTFQCLSSRVDHTECCRARGVSPFCLSMCSGDIKRVDYRHFRCLTHMSTYTNCILESHNVLPSQPLNFTVGPITHSWAVLNWRPPKKHARSLQGYRIFWRRVEPATMPPLVGGNSSSAARPIDGSNGDVATNNNANNDDFYYASAEASTNPYLLDGLLPATVYETFAVAVNKFGQSESSARFIFQTLADPEEEGETKRGLGPSRATSSSSGVEDRLPLHGNARDDSPPSHYNETTCCANSGLHDSCTQLCDYDLKVTDVSSLLTSCSSHMPVVLRCLAGSRNSVPCCRNRGVSDQCLNVCAGLTEHSPLVVATKCASDFGKIIRCMDEGSKQIPGAPVDLQTKDIKPDQVTIKWAPSSEDALRSDIEYHVRYQRLQTASNNQDDDPSSLIAVVPLHPLEHNLILTTNTTEATLDKLTPGARYSVYVTAENPYGISLPSLVLVLQTPLSDKSDGDTSSSEAYKRRATLGAPHSLDILRTDTETIFLKWVAPLFISSDAQIKYRVFYKLLGVQNATAEMVNNSTHGDGSVRRLSDNWTVVETRDTNVVLRNLRYSSQYAITVQAFTKQNLGHMSEILLAATARPVPPSLNHPIVINQPIEGNNITIMCVALGQPIPQISMFINGMLVQKRTQPYVIYHLVNLVRGHLTISCFASNGHGKDYASVQSRTEVSVKFPAKANTKTRDAPMSVGSTARMTCEISGNPQPTVVWTFAALQPENNNNTSTETTRVIQANDRITTLLVSQFENPFTWHQTLTIRNVSSRDAGQYQCRARNPLAESVDSIKLRIRDDKSSAAISGEASTKESHLKQLEESSNLMECCRNQNVSAKCLPVCSPDGLDVEAAFKTPDCQPHLDRLMYCAADGSDHRNCCRSRQVPLSCLRWCSGAKLNIPALCFLSSAIDINQCFQEGRTVLPGPPRNVRIMLAVDSEHNEREADSIEVATMTTSGHMGMFATSPSTSGAGDTPTTVSSNNNASVISSMAMMMGDSNSNPATMSNESATGPSSGGDQQAAAATAAAASQNSEPLILEWDPPAKNSQLVQYYRIFWRPFGSRELSRTVTNLTWIKLNDLNMNKQYEFVVKAANQDGSSVYSDPLAVRPSDILSRGSLSSVGMIWFMPSTGAAHVIGRVIWAVCFATIFMFSSLILVMFLERRGYLKRFASSKSNSSRVSFANPAYLKDSDNSHDSDNVSWETGHSLDVLGLPPQNNSELTFSKQNGSSNEQK